MKVALTLDDGPSEWTPQILDLLAKHNAKATFFVCGHAITKQTAPLLKRMVDEGHEIGNHTFDHPHCTRLADTEIADQLERTQDAILDAAGYTPIVWRAPYFDTDERVNAAAEKLGLRHVGATVDPADWRSDANTIVGRCYSLTDRAIIDLHDGIPPDGGTGTNTRQPTVDAVAQILAYYHELEFVTVTELNRAVDPQNVAVIVVTRGDVPLQQVLQPLEHYPFGAVWVWDNTADENLAVYGRYAAIDNVDQPVVIVIDDDVALTRAAIEGLLASYWPGAITANMPAEYRHRYPDSCLVGFGAIFDRDLPMRAFQQATDVITGMDEQTFNRTCDIVFTSLTPYKLVDLPFTYLPWTYNKERMFFQPGNGAERRAVLEQCRELREAALR